MAQNALIQVRVDKDLKETADALFAHLGMDTPTAIRVFLRQAVMNDGLPFEVRCVPNAETVAAMDEADQIARDPNAKKYDTTKELFEELRAECIE